MPTFVVPIVALVKKLLKPKIAARIYIHSKPEDIAKMYPKNILPKEYGGDNYSIDEIAGNFKNNRNLLYSLSRLHTFSFRRE